MASTVHKVAVVPLLVVVVLPVAVVVVPSSRKSRLLEHISQMRLTSGFSPNRSSVVALADRDSLATFCTRLAEVTAEPDEGCRSCRVRASFAELCLEPVTPPEDCRMIPSTLSAAFGFIAFSFSLWLRRSVVLEEALLADSRLPE
uniref:Uncharacterized protein n=1 Tax=Anopheles maculatus TaxID=74869 RepID=A0A182S6I2_9DIPT